MPYSGQTFTVVNTFVPQTTIESSAVNQNFNDIAANGLSVVVKLDGTSTMTGPIKVPNGSAAAPSITFGSDTNVGFYRIGADQMGVAIGGVLQGYWSSTGWTSYLADNGATVGPVATLLRDSSSPAASDIIGQVSFEGKDSAGNQQQYASVQSTILDPTSTSEDANLGFSTIVAGTVAERGYIGQGLVIGAPTGGDKGTGTINAQTLYANDLQVFPAFPLPGAVGYTCTNNSGTPNTQLDVAASVVVMADTSNITVTATSVSITINAGTTGANGIDTGALGANTWYYVWLISDGTTTAGLLSLSSTAPTMPVGYTYKVRLSEFRTGSSSTFLRLQTRGNFTQYKVVAASTTPNLPIMSSASVAVGSTTIPTWVSVSTSNYVPPTANRIKLMAGTITGSAAIMIAPNNSYGAINSSSNPPYAYSNVIGGAVGSSVNGDILLESTNVYWAASTGGDVYMLAIGWTSNVNAS